MTSSKQTLDRMSATGSLGITSRFDQVQAIAGTDAEIVAAVEEAEIPPLLAAVHVLTGDPALIAAELAPPLPPMGAASVPHGGMSESALATARELLSSALITARDHGWPRSEPDPALLDRTFRFLSGKDDQDIVDMLAGEFGFPTAERDPSWSADEVAPGRDFKVLIIGGGLAGITAAYRLAQAGLQFVVIERSPGPGGVWNDNRYPGCRLDTPNFAYGLSFAPKHDWPQEFSRQGEILAYLNSVVDAAELRDRFEFDSEVLRCEYDAESVKWSVTVRRSDGREFVHVVDVVLSAVGHLNRPKEPEIPGREEFLGRAFHSAQWPDDVDVRGKRVAVVGTGASGFQVVPAVAKDVASLTVFQRTPSWLLSTPNYHADIRSGMRALLESVPYFGRWFRLWQFALAVDARFPAVRVDPTWKHPISVGPENEQLRQECLALLAERCGDRLDLLEKLTPGYPPGAKRMVRDNGAYIDALKQSNVELVTEAMSGFTPRGVVTADGSEFEVDIAVFATGFHASAYMAPIEVVGEDGVALHEYWQGDCRAYLGMSVPGFPNLFIISGPNSGLVVNGNAVVTTEDCVQYVMSSIEFMLRERVSGMTVRFDEYQRYNDEIDNENRKKAWGVATVNTWYQGKDGRPAVPWPHSLVEFYRRTKQFDPAKYEII